MGGGSKTAPAPIIQQRTNPYNDAWIYDRFAQGQSRYDEVSDWMNQRQTALANQAPTMYNVGGGMQVEQKDFGQYVQGRFNQQEQAFNQRLAQLQATTGANRQSLQSQGEALARQGERDRIAAAYGGLGGAGVTGVQTKKRKNLGTYSGTGGGFNRSGMRIQNLNV